MRALDDVRATTGDHITEEGAMLDVVGDTVTMTIDYDPFIAAGYSVPVPARVMTFEAKLERKNIGYHAQMDHYNLDLNGAIFEWAKDLSTNDKDIVFVLNPEPLIAAGVRPEKVEGWIYAQVPVMVDGKETQVYKFLKPFNLK
jgi:hypothetical protein